jgi:argininosuccinate lyase
MPFRAAHALVGGLVHESLERHVPLVELVAAHPDLGEAAVELLEPGVAVTRRRTPGGAGPVAVAEQAERFERRREVDRKRLAQWTHGSNPGTGTGTGTGAGTRAGTRAEPVERG